MHIQVFDERLNEQTNSENEISPLDSDSFCSFLFLCFYLFRPTALHFCVHDECRGPPALLAGACLLVLLHWMRVVDADADACRSLRDSSRSDSIAFPMHSGVDLSRSFAMHLIFPPFFPLHICFGAFVGEWIHPEQVIYMYIYEKKDILTSS
jgi:hypothetical protein